MALKYCKQCDKTKDETKFYPFDYNGQVWTPVCQACILINLRTPTPDRQLYDQYAKMAARND